MHCDRVSEQSICAQKTPVIHRKRRALWSEVLEGVTGRCHGILCCRAELICNSAIPKQSQIPKCGWPALGSWESSGGGSGDSEKLGSGPGSWVLSLCPNISTYSLKMANKTRHRYWNLDEPTYKNYQFSWSTVLPHFPPFCYICCTHSLPKMSLINGQTPCWKSWKRIRKIWPFLNTVIKPWTFAWCFW